MRRIIMYILFASLIIVLIKFTFTYDLMDYITRIKDDKKIYKEFEKKKLSKGECYIKLNDFDQVFKPKSNPKFLNLDEHDKYSYHGSVIKRGNIDDKYSLFFYAHNTYDGKMFSGLTKYNDEFFLSNSKGVDVKTYSGYEHYKILFAKKINIEKENPWTLGNINSYAELLRYKIFLKSQDKNFRVNKIKIITLMTCTNEDEKDKRFFVVGERRKNDKFKTRKPKK